MSFSGRRQGLLVLFIFAFFLSACGALTPVENNSPQSQNQESAYCANVQTYSPGVTVTGEVVHQYLPLNTSSGLLSTPSTRATPFAEIRVRNSGGSTVQCGETDENGEFSVVVPSAGNYTILVYSRANGSKLKASVLEDYYANEPYSISKSFSVTSGGGDIGTLTAYALTSSSSKIEGAAFNILYQLYLANEFLRDEYDPGFVAPKVTVYWKKGFNPYSYFNGSSPLSFYRPGLRQLFILGGTSGLVHNVDTDHFDNSIILHEYAHFLEDVYARSDSPGGSHDGDTIIDPRLAWSEGWANFFQGTVLGIPYYIDTKGYGSSGGILIRVPLDEDGAGADYDHVTFDGEGTFREMSISRYLFKSVSDANVSFQSIWEAFSLTDLSGNPAGLASSGSAFRNVGLFNSYLGARIDLNESSVRSAWESVMANEKQSETTGYYADTLTAVSNGACTPTELDPARDEDDLSNQFFSNKFYRFDHDGSVQSLKLEYYGGSTNLDLDLHLYKEDYLYQETNESSNGTMVRSSARDFVVENGAESISLSGVPAGRYLINVKAYTYGKSTAQLTGSVTFRLKQVKNSVTGDLCPDNSP